MAEITRILIICVVGYFLLTNTKISPTQGTKNLFTTIQEGGNDVLLTGSYYLDRQLVINHDITLRGSGSVLVNYTSTQYAIIIEGTPTDKIIANLQGFTVNMNYKTGGIKIQYAEDVDLGFTIKNTRTGSYIDGVDVKNSQNILINDMKVEDVYYSGIAFDYCSNIEVLNSQFNKCAQVYPSGGAILCNIGCSNINLHGNTFSGDSMNDAIYCGTSTSPASNVRIENNDINLNELPGGAYMGSGIKVYSIGALISNNRVDMNEYAFGISDWGTDTTIQFNTVNDCYVGIKSPNTLNLNIVTNCVRNYEYY